MNDAQTNSATPRKIVNDLSGLKINHVQIISFHGRASGGQSLWNCRCDCGKEWVADGYAVKSGHTKSCGCFGRLETIKASITHGRSKTAEWLIWMGVKNRCLNRNDPTFKDYGGRGIKICQRWLSDFQNFFDDMGVRPSPSHSIERKNNNGDYEPDNCVWATRIEQGKNKRNNVILEFNGEAKTVTDWASEMGIKRSTLNNRIFQYGWSVSDALTTIVAKKINRG